MQLTQNVSLFRLLTAPLDDVLAHHGGVPTDSASSATRSCRT